MKTLRYYLSDLHLSDQRAIDRDASWFSPAHHEPELLRFLESEILAKASQVKEVVLLGDTFDNWQVPMEEVPPTYPEIFAANPRVMGALGELLARGIRLVITPGNHDYDLDEAQVKAALPGVIFAPTHVDTHPMVHAEHGHELTFFNSTMLDGRPNRPVGYFFGRMGPGRLPHGHSPRAVVRHLLVDRTLRRCFQPDFVADIMAKIFRAGGLGPGDRFVLDKDESISVAEVLKAYQSVGATLPIRERFWRLSQRPLSLVGSAARLGTQHQKPVVILGHTHGVGISLRRNGTWYANSGAWCQRSKSALLLEEDSEGVTLRALITQGGVTQVHAAQHVPRPQDSACPAQAPQLWHPEAEEHSH